MVMFLMVVVSIPVIMLQRVMFVHISRSIHLLIVVNMLVCDVERPEAVMMPVRVSIFMLVAMRVVAAALTRCVQVPAIMVAVRSEHTLNVMEYAITVVSTRPAVPEQHQVENVTDETNDGRN